MDDTPQTLLPVVLLLGTSVLIYLQLSGRTTSTVSWQLTNNDRPAHGLRDRSSSFFPASHVVGNPAAV